MSESSVVVRLQRPATALKSGREKRRLKVPMAPIKETYRFTCTAPQNVRRRIHLSGRAT